MSARPVGRFTNLVGEATNAEGLSDNVLTEVAPAKVNLMLHVTGRRPDGYHLLDSLVVFAGIGDRLTVAPSRELALTLDGPFAAGLQAESDNLVLRAARALADASGVAPHAALHLDKRLPVASGIGGGSSDAAAALRLLSAFWRVQVPAALLHSVAAGLGADVPVCLRPVPSRMGGVGEVLLPAPRVPPCGLVLVNPGCALATQAVFRARMGAFSPVPQLPAAWPNADSMADGLALLSNDLEQPAIGLCPVIAEVLAGLRRAPGCLLARMSGSGATCFGLFADAAQAHEAVAALSRPGWWCWGGGLWQPPLYAGAGRT